MKECYFEPDKEQYLATAYSSHSAYQLHYHIVWGTKYKKPVLVGKICDRLVDLITETCNSKTYHLLGLHIEPEHIHILVSLKPSQAISGFMKDIRGKASFILRNEFPDKLEKYETNSLWASGYYVHTVGFANVAQIKAYLDRQKEHHHG